MVGGGVEGVMDALREADPSRRVTAICHDLTKNTREGLIDGVLNFLIHQPREKLAAATVGMLQNAVELVRSRAGDPSALGDSGRAGSQNPAQTFVPIELYSVENI